MRLKFAFATIALLTPNLAAADPVDICLFQENDWAAVLKACDTALKDSDDPIEQGRYVLHRAFAHEGLGDLEAALKDQMLVGTYRPDYFVGYSNAASLAGELGDPELEVLMAQTSIDVAPDAARAYESMIYAKSGEGIEPECLPYADKVKDLLGHPIDWPFSSSKNASLLGTLGYCYYVNDRPNDALAAFRAAAYKEPDDFWVMDKLARVTFYDLKQDEKSIGYAEKAINLDGPYNVGAHIIVSAYTYLERYDEALVAVAKYSDTLDNGDEDLGTRNLLAWNLFLRDRSDEASPVVEAWAKWAMAEAEAGSNQKGSIWDTVAHVRAAVGDTDGAAQAFRLAFELYEDMDEVRTLYRYELTQAGFEVGAGDEGILAALDACAATGPACRLVPDDQELDAISK